ncbi:MAG: DM13 domain-containing protein [Desulfosarcinaceae bacterium]
MRNILAVSLVLVLLSWVAACAGNHDMMGEEDSMASGDTMAKDNMMAQDDAMAKDTRMNENKGMDSQDKSDMGMEKETSAMLMGSDGHHAAGEVSFGMGMNNANVLTLSDIKVDEIPDGYVYLAKDGDWRHGVQLGTLKQFSGTVSYDLPAGVNPDDYNTVVIWCKKFHVEIGRAHYGKKMM